MCDGLDGVGGCGGGEVEEAFEVGDEAGGEVGAFDVGDEDEDEEECDGECDVGGEELAHGEARVVDEEHEAGEEDECEDEAGDLAVGEYPADDESEHEDADGYINYFGESHFVKMFRSVY